MDPSPRPEIRKIPAPAPREPSARSLELSRYYADVQQALLTQGLLRTDGGGPDTPFNARQLAENFIRIAANEEFTLIGNRYADLGQEGEIRRFRQPVTLSVEFSQTVPRATQIRDRALLEKYAQRLTRASGHPVRLGSARGNFHVAVLDADGLAGYGPRVAEMIPGLDPAAIRQITQMPQVTYCTVYTFSRGPGLDFALAVIRAEHPNLMRDACYHEEIAQGLGLSNDSDLARPSIFNDDEEFALLTTHDEYLLRMLYDTRMPLGADPATARPVAAELARELVEPSS